MKRRPTLALRRLEPYHAVEGIIVENEVVPADQTWMPKPSAIDEQAPTWRIDATAGAADRPGAG